MMRDESKEILDSLLAQWHRWACGYRYVGGINSSPMFRDAKTSKGWDSVEEIIDSEIDGSRMEAVQFHIFELRPVYRTALQLNARNLHTGKTVWDSPRLPPDPEERAIMLMEARNLLLKRLLSAGVL